MRAIIEGVTMLFTKQYIEDRTIPIPFSGCWVWESVVTNAHVNVQLVGGKPTYAHRVAYALWNALELEQLDGLIVHHKCEVPTCCNPMHLELKTDIEHKREHHAARPLKEFCVHGHEFTPENSIWRGGRHRDCRECNRERNRRSMRRRRLYR